MITTNPWLVIVSGMNACILSCFSGVQLFVTPRTTAHQAPLSMGSSRQEYWSHFLLQGIFHPRDWTWVWKSNPGLGLDCYKLLGKHGYLLLPLTDTRHFHHKQTENWTNYVKELCSDVIQQVVKDSDPLMFTPNFCPKEVSSLQRRKV